jgi:uncharacterized protein YlxW (UPF0749 family)
MKKRSAQVTLTVVSFLLGLLLVIQFRTQGKLAASVFAQSSTDQALIISGLVEGNSALRKEIGSLEGDLSNYQRTAGQSNLEGMVGELNRLKVMNGMVEVSGPGVEVQVSGGVTALDLQDLINEARNAGAEALSLNGYRLVSRSVVVASNGTVRLEENRLSPPYRLQAIGHPETLEKALNRKGGLLALLQYSYPNATITVAERDNMVLPLYLGKYEFRYARAVK